VRRTPCFIASIAALAALLIGPFPANTAGIGIDVSPAKLDMSIAPGGTYNLAVLVRNEQAATVHVQASEVDFGMSQSGDYEFGAPGSRPNTLMKYATVNPREFDLEPNAVQQVRVTFALPTSANLTGEQAGIIFFQTRPDRRRNSVMFAARVASKIYNTIPNTSKLSGAIDKMSVAVGPPGTGPLYRVVFKNTGNTHVYLKGSIDVKKDGKVVDHLPITQLPIVERGGLRMLELSGRKLDPGSYDVTAIVDYGGTTLTGGQVTFEAH
jgi:P pilus assembly chaperone PapD